MQQTLTPADASSHNLFEPVGRQRPEWIVVGIGAVVVVALRVWILTFARYPRVMPDEVGTWAIARYLVRGSADISMLNQPLYPVGPAILLAPLTLVGGPIQQYQTFGLLAAVLLVAAAWLLARSLAAWLDLTDALDRALVAFAGSALPAVFFTTAFSWSEFVVPLYWAGLVAVAFAVRSGSTIAVCSSAVCVGVAPLVHGRFLPVPLIWLAAYVLRVALDRRRRDGPRRVVACYGPIAIAVVVAAVSLLVRRVVAARVWVDPASVDSDWAHNLDNAFFYKSLVLVAVGQLWYAIVSTYGVALIGAAAILVGIRRLPTLRFELGVLAAFLVANFAVSCVYLAGWFARTNLRNQRVDHLFYGRYIDGACWVLFVIGCAAIVRTLPTWLNARTATALVAGAVGYGLAVDGVVARVSGLVELRPLFGPTVAGVSTLPFEQGTYDIARWSMFSACVLAALLLPAGSGSWMRRALLVAVVTSGAVLAAIDVRGTHDKWGYGTSFEGVPAPTVGGDTVYVADDVVDRRGYSLIVFAQQYQLVSRGWDFEFGAGSSIDLLARVPDDAGLLVVPAEAAVDQSDVVGRVGPAVLVLTDRGS
jgi:hypothetical protein